MSFYKNQFYLAVLLASSFASPVFAQALAEEVVQEYVSEMAKSGVVVALGAKTVSGSTVEWKDVTMTTPQNEGEYKIAFIRAEEIGGDKVSMTYPKSVSFKIDPKGEQPAMYMIMTLRDMTHIISGTKDARNHDFSAAALNMVMTATAPQLTMNFAFSDIVAKYQNTGGEVRNSKGIAKAAGLNLTYLLNDKDVQMSMVLAYNNLATEFDIDLVSQENMEQMFDGTRNMLMTYSMGSTSSTIDMDTPDASVFVEGTTGSGAGSFSIQGGELAMQGTGNDFDYSVKMKELPLPPFQIGVDQSTMALKMPLEQTNTPAEARVQFGFFGLKASDTVWGMIDPTGSLPREKATLNLDLTTKVKWLVNLMKIDEARSMPAEVSEVTINDVTLKIAGASFNGTGSATLDNSKFPPEPVGEVNLDLKGGVGLLNKLVALGLIPQQQGQMVKMMSGMFTVPGGAGTDHLISKIKMKKGGAILANGQRVK
ncbi:MAG: DUF2125 domain-containing protein [Amylibacter sp.]